MSAYTGENFGENIRNAAEKYAGKETGTEKEKTAAAGSGKTEEKKQEKTASAAPGTGKTYAGQPAGGDVLTDSLGMQGDGLGWACLTALTVTAALLALPAAVMLGGKKRERKKHADALKKKKAEKETEKR